MNYLLKKGERFGEVRRRRKFSNIWLTRRVLYRNGDKWYWMSDAFPAHNMSVCAPLHRKMWSLSIKRIWPNVKVIGEMDRFSAMTLLHEEAIYLHQGIQYQVEKLDWEEKKAYVREVNVDYFTDANLAVELKVLEEDKRRKNGSAEIGYGDVSVLAKATIFKKIKFETHENIGSGPIYLPEEELHTASAWISAGQRSGRSSRGQIGARVNRRRPCPRFDRPFVCHVRPPRHSCRSASKSDSQ